MTRLGAEAAQIAQEKSVPEILCQQQLMQIAALRALTASPEFARAVLQGGSAISGCYGGVRLSQDLDFVRAEPFTPVEVAEIAGALKYSLAARFSTDVHVKSPRLPASGDVPVYKWWVRAETYPGRPDLPCARLKIEVAQLPAMTAARARFAPAPAGDNPEAPHVLVESRHEILADKALSFAAQTARLRYRDLWDISFILEQTPMDSEAMGFIRQAVSEKAYLYGVYDLWERYETNMERYNAEGRASAFARELRAQISDPVWARAVEDAAELARRFDVACEFVSEVIVDEPPLLERENELPWERER